MAGRGGLCQEDCEVAGAPTGGGRLDGGPVRDCAVDRDSAARLPELSVAAAGTGPLG
ncbi:hypothetical protein ACPCAG_19410 [Streptomyces pseudogriseolus]|uniref:hypothetical protein n=1 Tax=Streptomyces pseudogriseolus TaxID=36817 RepID=UPI003FA1BDC8